VHERPTLSVARGVCNRPRGVATIDVALAARVVPLHVVRVQAGRAEVISRSVAAERRPGDVCASRGRLLAVVLAVLVATALGGAGCSLTGSGIFASKVRDCAGFDTPLTTFSGSVRKQLHVRVVARRVDNDFALVAERGPDSFVLVGFTPLGTKSFTLVRRGDSVDVDNKLGLAEIVPPRNLMSDVLGMSLPSNCSPSADEDVSTTIGAWRISDTCREGRPVERRIARVETKPDKKPAVEIKYEPDAIMVRQHECRYLARYVIEQQQLPPIDVSVPAPAATSAPAVLPDATTTSAPGGTMTTPGAAVPPAAAPAASTAAPAAATPGPATVPAMTSPAPASTSPSPPSSAAPAPKPTPPPAPLPPELVPAAQPPAATVVPAAPATAPEPAPAPVPKGKRPKNIIDAIRGSDPPQ
jgi:hypothetical protein